MSDVAASPDEPKKKPGPKPWQPTESELTLIEEMIADGKRLSAIGKAIGRGVDALNRQAKAAIDRGRVHLFSDIESTVYEAALKGNLTAAFFVLKTKCGWRETTHHEHSGTIVHADLTRLNDKQLEEYGRISAIAAGLDPDTIIVTPLNGYDPES